MRRFSTIVAVSALAIAVPAGFFLHRRHSAATAPPSSSSAPAPAPLTPELMALLTQVERQAQPPNFGDFFGLHPSRLRKPEQPKIKASIDALSRDQIQDMIATLLASAADATTPASPVNAPWRADPRHQGFMLLLEALAAKDPAAAFAEAGRGLAVFFPAEPRNLSSLGIGGEFIPVLATAATVDPTAAVRWFKSHPDAFPCLNHAAAERMMEAIATRDPATALAQIAPLGTDWEDTSVTGISNAAESPQQRMALIQALRQGPAAIDPLKPKILEGIGSIAAKEDAEESSRAWLASASGLSQQEQDAIQRGISNVTWQEKVADLEKDVQQERQIDR